MSKPTPLLAPDVRRMVAIERQLATIEPRLRELAAQIDATSGPREVAMQRLYDLDVGQPTETQLRAEFSAADRAWRGAVEAWRVIDDRACAFRDEWLQLQVVRAFLPRCSVCEQIVGPAYLEFGEGESRRALCLDCFDDWAHNRAPVTGQLPPSDRIERTAAEARERETARRRGAQQAAGSCWHCGGTVDDLRDTARLHASGGTPAPVVVLRVTALVPQATTPELGQVCLPCMDGELALFGRWSAVQTDLIGPSRRRQERVLHRFARSDIGFRTTVADPAPARRLPAAGGSHGPPSRRSAGRR